MSERLDRIEALLERTAEQQAENSSAIAATNRDVDTLIEEMITLANKERRRADARYAAAMEVIQTLLLVELSKTNRQSNRLEQAS